MQIGKPLDVILTDKDKCKQRELDEERKRLEHQQNMLDVKNLVKLNFSKSRYKFTIFNKHNDSNIPWDVYDEVALKLSATTNYALSFEIKNSIGHQGEYTRVTCYITKKNVEVLDF